MKNSKGYPKTSGRIPRRCVLAEMAARTPLFPGTDAEDQVRRVVKATRAVAAPDAFAASLAAAAADPSAFAFAAAVPGDYGTTTWAALAPGLDEDGAAVLAALLVLDPRTRASARDVLDKPYFDAPRAYARARLAVAATPRAHDASVLRRSDSGSSVASHASDICVGDVDVDVDDLEAAPDVRAIRRILLARDFERATPTVTP